VRLFSLIFPPALLALLACSNADGTPGGTAGHPSGTGALAGSGGTGAVGSSGNTAVGGRENAGGSPAAAGTSGPGSAGGASNSGAGGNSPAAGAGGAAGSGNNSGSNAGGRAALGGAAGATAGAGPSPGGAGSGAGGAAASGPCNAVATVAAMKLGWNLGNALDSVDATKSDTTVETAWGNPAITAALLQAVKAAGFGAVRIPVSWIGRFGAAPEYPINAAFMARVEAVVKYALDANLYVIINLHHDGGEGVTGQWLRLVDGSGKVTDANNQAVLAQFKKMWAQIATHFASYGDHLLFESMNEIKVGYDTPLSAYYDEVTALNQAFVDTVRATGSYNPSRCLVVPGYNTNIDYTVAGFVKPTDTSAGKLILSDHYYDPWSFAGEASTHTWGMGSPGADTWGQEDGVRGQIEKLKTKFIDQGLPMIWGEYGAVKQTGYENYQRYYVEYVTKAVHDAGIVPFLWDNGSKGSGAEAFGLFDRGNNSVLYPTLLEAMQRAVTSSYTLADVAKP